MKTALRIIGILLTICVLAVGFRLPDTILSFIDDESAKVQTEDLTPINLDMKRELSIYEKLSLANSVQPSVAVTRDQTVSTSKDMQNGVKTFINEMFSRLGVYETFDIEFLEMIPYMYHDNNARESVVFWHIQAEIGEKLMLEFVIDDTSVEVLAFTIVLMDYFSDFPAMNDDLYMILDMAASNFQQRFGGYFINREEYVPEMDASTAIHVKEDWVIEADGKKYVYPVSCNAWMVCVGDPYYPFGAPSYGSFESRW